MNIQMGINQPDNFAIVNEFAQDFYNSLFQEHEEELETMIDYDNPKALIECAWDDKRAGF